MKLLMFLLLSVYEFFSVRTRLCKKGSYWIGGKWITNSVGAVKEMFQGKQNLKSNAKGNSYYEWMN